MFTSDHGQKTEGCVDWWSGNNFNFLMTLDLTYYIRPFFPVWSILNHSSSPRTCKNSVRGAALFAPKRELKAGWYFSPFYFAQLISTRATWSLSSTI